MSAQAAGGPLILAEILDSFEARTTPFDVHEVADAVRRLARQHEATGTAVTSDIRAEWLGFTLMENHRGDEGFTWGTYYGPVGVLHDEKGTRIEMPSIAELTPDVIAYWQERARIARHPLLRIRYADLVWEFGRRAKLRPGPEFPRAVIEATVAAAGEELFEHSTVGFIGLRRALSVAISSEMTFAWSRCVTRSSPTRMQYRKTRFRARGGSPLTNSWRRSRRPFLCRRILSRRSSPILRLVSGGDRNSRRRG